MSYIDYLDSLSKKQLMVMLARQRQEATQGIALIGMGCRFPGGIGDPRTLWSASREAQVAPTESAGPPLDSLGRPRWNLDAPDLAGMGDLLRHGAFLDDVDLFDAEYFGISDAEALHMDPQQRVLLEVTVQALADANVTRAQLRGESVGIFVAAGQVEYPFASLRNGLSVDGLSPFMGTGSGGSALSGRIGMALGVAGPAISIDTASSSMLTAAHLASHSLRRGECDVALIGVCNLLLSPFSTAILAKAGMVSPSGRSRPFTAEADGHARGEGCGVVVLKRHADAVAEGDHIYALLKGSAVHQQGDRPGMSVTPASAQKTVVSRALRDAGLQPQDVHYVEAQANGSKLGGVIEAEALSYAYARASGETSPLHLGSCKANLGYLETASGAPALMKTALALKHGEIPPQVEADSPDPSVPWERLGLRFSSKPTPWPVGKRRAGVSGYGFAGTIAHVVLENDDDETPVASTPGPALLVLSAHNHKALAGTARRLREHLLEQSDWTTEAVCRTLAEGRDQLTVRHAAVVTDRSDLLAELTRVGDQAQGSLIADAERLVWLRAPDLSDEAFDAALARRRSFAALDARIQARTEVAGAADVRGAGRPWSLAWTLGWLDLFATTGIAVSGGVFEGQSRHAAVDVLTGALTADEVWAARGDRAGSTSAAPVPWRLTDDGHVCVVSRDDASDPLDPIPLDQLDQATWLGLVGRQFLAGVGIDFCALSVKSRLQLCRLPGPVLTGRSYWPEHNLWC